MREYHAQFCEKQKGQFLLLTHPYIHVKGQWVYLYRAVNKFGDTVDFMLSEHRDEAAATASFKQAIDNNGFRKRPVLPSGATSALALQ
jgi:putative transposase